jgi:outer membrane protein TolC
MCRRPCRRWLTAVFAALVSGGHPASARTDSIPAPVQDLTRFKPRQEPVAPATDVGGAAPAPARRAATNLPNVSALPESPAQEEPAGSARPEVDPDVHGLPVNLASALQLAGVRPLDIAAATLQVRQGLALLLQAKVLWIPNINGGVDYSRHDGVQQNLFTGGLFQKGRQSLFTGGGPYLNVAVTEAIYEPLAAKRVVSAREANVQAARNDALLSVAQAYFALQQARGRLLGVDATIGRARKLVDFAQGLAPALIAPLEINRARAELQSLLQTREVAIRDWRVVSAQLAEILLLDPETLLEPIEPPFVQVSLIPATETVNELVAVAINNRPEVAAQRDLLAAANQRLKEEKKRPFLPNLYVLSPATSTGLLAAGNLAGGANGSMNNNGHSAFFDLAAVWELQNAGIGNIGRIRQRRAEQDLTAVEVTRTVFRVRAEVSQALARMQTARARVPQTETGLVQATESADRNFVGLRETTRPAGELLRLVVRPQEVVAALIALELAFEQYSSAVNDYNAAQFELYRALGQPAQWVTTQPAHAPLAANDPRLVPAAPPGAIAPIGAVGAGGR